MQPTTTTLTPAYIIAVVVDIVGLFVTQGVIDNRTGKLVTGLAVITITAAGVIAHALFHGRVNAARIAANAVLPPVSPAPVPPAVKAPARSRKPVNPS